MFTFSRHSLFVASAALLLFTVGQIHAGQPETVVSPNGLVKATVAVKENSAAGSNTSSLVYSIEYGGKSVLLDSPFSLDFKDSASVSAGLTIQNVTRRAEDKAWQRLYGKRKQVRDHFNEMTLEVREAAAPNRSFELVFRAYDDGIAFRYSLPKAWGAFELSAENTVFQFPSDATVWAADFGGFASSQETDFKRQNLSELAPNRVYGCPLLAQIEPELWAACTEADQNDWSGMFFKTAPEASNAVRSALAPYPGKPGVVVHSTAPRSSPWRVVMVSDRPGAFIESDILENLNAPAAFDASWVQPGKASWDRWWCGSYAPELDFKLGVNTASMKYFIDFAAEMNWQYQVIDEGWYGPAFPPHGQKTLRGDNATSSSTNTIPQIDLPELVAYAKGKGIKLILWLHWGRVDQEMDVSFPLYEKWGISGLKIDFMDREDQEMVQFYERVAKKAAEHHLLVDFHGAYKPTGWHRTYPNVITREGVMGNEYNKWSDRITPEHTVTLPFTRGMLGGMDFTPGGFRQKTPKTFRAVGGDKPGPFVMGTRVHQLAMLVVYESALQVLCDSPYNYHSSPAGTDFLKVVPTTWDDTKVIHGEVGKVITVVRRSGAEWYVGSMSGTDARKLEIPLTFLGQGKYEAEIWADAYEAADYPDRLTKQTRFVTAADTLDANLAAAGGYLVRLKPIP